jgi:hypothetical protein
MVKKEAAEQMGFVLGEELLVFQVWQHALDRSVAYTPATLPCPRPKVSDQVIDPEGFTWVVRDVDEDFQKTFMRLTCQKCPGQ